MNRSILVSLVVIGAAVIVAGGTTMSLFTDTEQSEDNTFATGSLDLKLDYEESYNGELQEDVALTDDPGAIFNLSDIKPGDTGEATISFHVFDNPAFVNMSVNQTADEEISCTEPESKAEGGSCGQDGELGENLELLIWYDDGNNELDEGEEVIFNGTAEALESEGISDSMPLDSDRTQEGIQPYENSTTNYIGVAWELPLDVGNEVQTDAKEFDISFTAEQARHNDRQPVEQEEPFSLYYQVDLVGGEPIDDLSTQSYHNRDDMIRFLHGAPGVPVDNESERGQVQCVESSEPMDIDTAADTATAEFDVGQDNCEVSLVSYGKPYPGWIANRADEQIIFDESTGNFSTGTHNLTVAIPDVN